MGCDGGSIPKRDELVKQKQRQVKVDQNILNRVHWFTCALSKKPLIAPVAACGLGKLYNRDAILEFLLDKTAYGDGDLICKHIRTLKDVVTLQLEPNPSFSENQSPSLTNHDQEPVARYICPITMKEMNGKHRFVYLDTCGCVMSEQAMKEVPSKTCIKCAKPFESFNVILLNPKPEELEVMEQALVEKQARVQAEKKEKKKAKEKKKDVEKLNGADSSLLDSSSSSKRKLEEATESPKHKKQHLSEKDKTPVQPTQSAVHSLTAAVAAKVAEQMAASANRQKSAALQSLFVNGRDSRENFMKR
ncbi:MAG: Rtf2 RING-finger-domain-containing protein [Benniella sp.]|nr:MAG: Rtf2 RING-finger-domain-containing protein [Benniella sp.]